ncbi:MAG: hypothetical protein KGJ93_04365 [Patescibacteria group bacterium]|nr:hypothetical protein [Patescibacteria group bacterium]
MTELPPELKEQKMPRTFPKGVAEMTPQISMADIKKAGLLSGKKESALIMVINYRLPTKRYNFFSIGNVQFLSDEMAEGYTDQEDEEPEDEEWSGKGGKAMTTGWIEFDFIAHAYHDPKNKKNPIVITGYYPQNYFSVSIESTQANYGGRGNFWFKCPGLEVGPRCYKRVRILYFKDKRLACRTCHDLAYMAQNLNKEERKEGLPVPVDKLNNMKKEIKKVFYKGKLTKRAERFRRMKERAEAAAMTYSDNSTYNFGKKSGKIKTSKNKGK